LKTVKHLLVVNHKYNNSSSILFERVQLRTTN
jgi:hypothetical protein